MAGTLLNRKLPNVELTDQDGRRFTLTDQPGKVVLVAPFLTLCQESCPLTTGAFKQIQAQLIARHLANRVVLVETTVDPQRDTPKRLHAFARLAGIQFKLATGKPAQLTRLWRFLGVSVFHKGEDDPPATDWLTGAKLTYDVVHTDALFLLGADGRERIVVGGMATIHALPQALKNLLSPVGRQDLRRPSPGWTVTQAVDDVSYLLDRSSS